MEATSCGDATLAMRARRHRRAGKGGAEGATAMGAKGRGMEIGQAKGPCNFRGQETVAAAGAAT